MNVVGWAFFDLPLWMLRKAKAHWFDDPRRNEPICGRATGTPSPAPPEGIPDSQRCNNCKRTLRNRERTTRYIREGL